MWRSYGSIGHGTWWIVVLILFTFCAFNFSPFSRCKIQTNKRFVCSLQMNSLSFFQFFYLVCAIIVVLSHLDRFYLFPNLKLFATCEIERRELQQICLVASKIFNCYRKHFAINFCNQ